MRPGPWGVRTGSHRALTIAMHLGITDFSSGASYVYPHVLYFAILSILSPFDGKLADKTPAQFVV